MSSLTAKMFPARTAFNAFLGQDCVLANRSVCRQCRIAQATLSSSVRPFSMRATSVKTVAQPTATRPRMVQSSAQFSKESRRGAKTMSSLKAYNRMGVFSPKSVSIFLATGLALIIYFNYEKGRMERKKVTEMSKGYGKPKVGGPFTLTDLDGKEFTEKELLGKYSIVYFGFSHCPDICPDELDKLAQLLDKLQESHPDLLRPVFISCDPFRDTPAVLRDYLAEFHPKLVGLTGTWDQVKNVCKQYRVYFSTPPNIKPGEEDYLVDHSIYFYVMDPEGDFVECIGRQNTAEDGARIIGEHIKDWKRDGKPIDKSRLKTLHEK